MTIDPLLLQLEGWRVPTQTNTKVSLPPPANPSRRRTLPPNHTRVGPVNS